ncbi:hypothetical protein G9A89_011694 [Geosiphon pyriformis]|nr:hypothetical protein G9A89_011694 [Geosiphon pyriformis]
MLQPEDFQLPRNPTQQQEPISTSANIIDYLQENKNNHSESLKSEETESKPEEITENKKEMAAAYIAKIPEFTVKDNNTSPQKWLDKVQKAGDANSWIAARMLKAIPYFLQGTAEEWFENLEKPFENWQAFKDAFLQQFANNNTSITLRNCFCNIKQETSKTVITYLEKFNKLFRQIRQLETNNYYSDAQILNQFIAGLKNKLIKKVCPHAPADLATAIRHAKSYEMAMEEANHTRLINLAIGETSSAAKEKIDQLTKKLVPQNSGQQRPNHYHTQPSYLTIPEKSDFQQTAPFEDEVAAPRSNPSNHTILPAQIAQNANLSNIFSFEFEANESPFLLSNTAVNEQKTITAIPAQTVIVTANSMKKTPVGEINNFPFSINGITIPVKILVMDAPQYQALVGNDWLFKANANLNWKTQELKISYQRQYTIVPAICNIFNKQSEKAPVFEFEEKKEMPLAETYMALGSTFNWAEETEQKIFEESRR